jgi:hypothetical protein
MYLGLVGAAARVGRSSPLFDQSARSVNFCSLNTNANSLVFSPYRGKPGKAKNSECDTMRSRTYFGNCHLVRV